MINTDLTIGDLITVTPKGEATFEVLAIDDLSDCLVYADRVHNPNNLPPQWYSTAYARRVDEQATA